MTTPPTGADATAAWLAAGADLTVVPDDAWAWPETDPAAFATAVREHAAAATGLGTDARRTRSLAAMLVHRHRELLDRWGWCTPQALRALSRGEGVREVIGPFVEPSHVRRQLRRERVLAAAHRSSVIRHARRFLR